MAIIPLPTFAWYTKYMKPRLLLAPELYIFAIIYAVTVGLWIWLLSPQLSTLLFVIGAVIGLHLFEIIRLIMQSDSTTSLFYSAFTQGLITIVTLFVLTSTADYLGKGVVLFLNMRLLFLQYRAFQNGTLSRWLSQKQTVSSNLQQTYLLVLLVFFILESLIFVVVK